MWAVLATIAFILALIFHIAGGSVAQYFWDALVLGFVFLSLHLWVPWGPWPWRGGPPPP